MIATLSSGLQVRLSDKNSHQKPRKTSFDFVWAPSHQHPRAVAWQPLALHETTFPHLRLHRLTENDDLGDFLALMSSIPATLALVLVNPASHYRSLGVFGLAAVCCFVVYRTFNTFVWLFGVGILMFTILCSSSSIASPISEHLLFSSLLFYFLS